MSWNYRVIQRTWPTGETYVGIHEVYYDEAGAIEGWTAEPVAPGGETLAELLLDVDHQAIALRKVVLVLRSDGTLE